MMMILYLNLDQRNLETLYQQVVKEEIEKEEFRK